MFAHVLDLGQDRQPGAQIGLALPVSGDGRVQALLLGVEALDQCLVLRLPVGVDDALQPRRGVVRGPFARDRIERSVQLGPQAARLGAQAFQPVGDSVRAAMSRITAVSSGCTTMSGSTVTSLPRDTTTRSSLAKVAQTPNAATSAATT